MKIKSIYYVIEDGKAASYFDLIDRAFQFHYDSSVFRAFLRQIPTSAPKTDLLPTSLTQMVGLPTMVV